MGAERDAALSREVNKGGWCCQPGSLKRSLRLTARPWPARRKGLHLIMNLGLPHPLLGAWPCKGQLSHARSFYPALPLERGASQKRRCRHLSCPESEPSRRARGDERVGVTSREVTHSPRCGVDWGFGEIFVFG